MSLNLIRNFLFLLLVLICSAGTAAERLIVLEDGSQLRGEVVSLHDGQYTVETKTLGTVVLNSSQIRSIGVVDSPASPAGDTASGAVNAITSGIANDPGLLTDVLKLQQDSRMQAVLQDPELMEAVRRLDFETLSRDPKFRALMNSPAVREIQGRVAEPE